MVESSNEMPFSEAAELRPCLCWSFCFAFIFSKFFSPKKSFKVAPAVGGQSITARLKG